MTFATPWYKLRFMLDVRRMRVLREVAARGSFSAAAEALSYTQSAVSQQIAALEREAGTRLVERGARGVRLTDAGRTLVEHADVILARLADAESELEAIAGLRVGEAREDRVGVADERAAGIGEPDPAGRAVDERRARLALERGDLLGDGRLGVGEGIGGGGEGAALGDLPEHCLLYTSPSPRDS